MTREIEQDRKWLDEHSPYGDVPHCVECNARRELIARYYMAEVERLRAERDRYRACHESELGVCQEHCDVVADLRAEVEKLRGEPHGSTKTRALWKS